MIPPSFLRNQKDESAILLLERLEENGHEGSRKSKNTTAWYLSSRVNESTS
jgi:hypothetical protein